VETSAPQSLAGTYARTRGRKLSYTYEALWKRVKDGAIVWEVKIRRAGDLLGATNGRVVGTPAGKEEATVRAQVEDCIERLGIE
jgi:hypothetical protein